MTILVIGAGIVGLSVAYELASRGASVQVIDPRGIGQGATRASAGMLAPYVEGHIAALRHLGVCGLAMYEGFVERIRADSGQEVVFERNGTLQVALDEGEAAGLRSAVAALSEADVEHVFMDGSGARDIEPGLPERTVAALLVPAHGYVGAPGLASAMEAALSKHGATLAATRALGVEARRDRVDVRTPDGVLSADAVVVAAGSWFSQLGLGSNEVVRPIRGQLLHLRLDRPAAARVIWGSGCYIVPWRDGTVLVGATMENVGFDEHATAAGVQQLLASSLALLPALKDARFEEARAGLRPMIADELPAIGRSSTLRNVFYAIGHYRNGVLLAPLTAQILADLVLEGRERPELTLVRPARVGL